MKYKVQKDVGNQWVVVNSWYSRIVFKGTFQECQKRAEKLNKKYNC